MCLNKEETGEPIDGSFVASAGEDTRPERMKCSHFISVTVTMERLGGGAGLCDAQGSLLLVMNEAKIRDELISWPHRFLSSSFFHRQRDYYDASIRLSCYSFRAGNSSVI